MISVVLPALNEEKNIEATVETVLFAAQNARVEVEIIIVNDGSTDGTARVVQKLEAQYPFIRHIHFEQNQGLGAGFKAALKIAKYPKISTFPGDNCCRPEIMYKLFASAHRADFLLSFLVNTELRAVSRRILSTIYSHTYGVIFGLPFKYMNGSPIYSVEKLRSLELHSGRYGIFAEINVKLARLGGTFAEIPDYVKANQLKSSALKLRNLMECVWTFAQLVMEVHVFNRKKFGHIVSRVIIEEDVPWLKEKKFEEQPLRRAD